MKATAVKPDTSTLGGWRVAHGAHGRIWLDVKIGEYDHHRCSCGDKFIDPPKR